MSDCYWPTSDCAFAEKFRALEAELADAREALNPFAKWADDPSWLEAADPDDTLMLDGQAITAGDLRRARAFAAGKQSGEVDHEQG